MSISAGSSDILIPASANASRRGSSPIGKTTESGLLRVSQAIVAVIEVTTCSTSAGIPKLRSLWA